MSRTPVTSSQRGKARKLFADESSWLALEEETYRQCSRDAEKYGTILRRIAYDKRHPENTEQQDDDAKGADSTDALRNSIEELRARKESVYGNQGGATKCPQCHRKDGVAVTLRQTRSADEPMTAFCRCVCGARWTEAP